MTTRDDDRRDRDDDEEFEAFLRGDDALSAQLRGLEQPAPPPALDARIRIEAERALEQAVGAANDAEEKALVASPLGRWRAPLALAATVVIGVSLGLQWKGGHEATPSTLSDALPAGAPAAAVQDPAALARLPDVTAPAAPAETPMQAPAHGGPHGGTLQARPTTQGDARADQPMPPPAPPAAPAPPPAPAPVEFRRKDPAGVALLTERPVPGDEGIQARYAPAEVRRLAPAGAPVAPAPAGAAAAGERPRKWLALIGELLDLGLQDDARTTWRRFREDYPQYPVPPELQRRIDAALGPDAGR